MCSKHLKSGILLLYVQSFFEVFLGGREHQFDPVQLVYFTGTGVIVDGNDVGLRVAAAKLFDDTLADNVVGQTAKGLGANDIIDTLVDQLDHFAG